MKLSGLELTEIKAEMKGLGHQAWLFDAVLNVTNLLVHISTDFISNERHSLSEWEEGKP